MATNTEPVTFVVFRKWSAKQGGDVIALFPYEKHDYRHCVCYEHVGQHGSALYEAVIQMTRLATPEEYAPLLRELTSVGYNLKVITRKGQ